jgi:hypothetical protein
MVDPLAMTIATNVTESRCSSALRVSLLAVGGQVDFPSCAGI